MRTLPEHNGDEIIKRVKEIMAKLSKGKRKFGIDVKTNIPGVLTDPNNEFVKRARDLNAKIFGINPSLTGSGPANEGYMLIKRGIPTITGYGPLGGNYHSENEYADLESIESSLRFLTELTREQQHGR